MVFLDALKRSLQFVWPVILNSASGHSSPFAVGQRATARLPLLQVCSFLSQNAETGNARKSAGNVRKSAGKVRKSAEKVRTSAESTEISGTFAWGNAYLLFLVNCTHSNGFCRPMSMTVSKARTGAEREILAEKEKLNAAVSFIVARKKNTVFAQMPGFHGNARIFADSRKKVPLIGPGIHIFIYICINLYIYIY